MPVERDAQIPSLTLFSPDTAALIADISRGSGYHSAVYRGFFKIKKAETAVIASVGSIPPPTATLPSRETFLASQTAVAAQSDLRDSFPSRIKPDGQNPSILLSLDELFREEIAKLDDALSLMLAGAKDAITSNNPDRLRHASTSLREFLKRFLMSLAPDREFHPWAKAQNLAPKDLAKLEMRVRFIARNAPCAAELSFYEIDVAQVRLLLNHFNEGVHLQVPGFGKEDLPALLRRLEGFVATLLEVDRAYNR